MRRLFMFNMVTLDGFFEGPDRQIDWHTVDREFNDFAVEQLSEVDTLVFGRVTYEPVSSKPDRSMSFASWSTLPSWEAAVRFSLVCRTGTD